MRTGNAEFVPFDPNAKQPKMSYKVTVFVHTFSLVPISDTADRVHNDILDLP